MIKHYAIASDKIISKVVENEAVIINLTTGMYFATDGIGAIVWDLASQGIATDAITDTIAHTYAGVEASADLAAFVAALIDGGLLVAATATEPAALPAAIAWPTTYAAPQLDAYDDMAEMVALDPPLPELSQVNPL